MTVYVEASAAGKLLVEEPESPALARHLDGLAAQGTAIAACVLLETELRRLAVRESLDQTAVTVLLAGFDLLDADRALYRAAGLLPGRHLRSLDALHVAAALRVDADVMLSYDRRQVAAAQAAGLTTLAPS